MLIKIYTIPVEVPDVMNEEMNKFLRSHNVLSEVEFEKFSKLRECRKAIAKEEAIPAYAVFTDAELAELVKLNELNLVSVKKISGIGTGKSERYGQRIIDLYHSSHETSGISN